MLLSKRYLISALSVLLIITSINSKSNYSTDLNIQASGFSFFAEKNSLLTLLSNANNDTKTDNKAYSNYIKLKKLYLRWNKGLFGSKRHYKRKIYKYLITIIGHEIVTGYNYSIISPDDSSEITLGCSLFVERWLQIKGKIKKETIKDIVEANPKILKEWWRSKKLLSVHGTLKDFRLGKDKWGEVVTLYLSDIRLEEGDHTKKDSNK